MKPFVRRVAVLSLHTSPLVQPGTGDGGGMNVYVREFVSALAQAGLLGGGTPQPPAVSAAGTLSAEASRSAK